MLSIQLLLILLQGTFVFLITGKHAFWICRESEDGARRTSAYRNTWRGDQPRAQFGHNLRRATAGLQTLICGIVCTFSWRLQNTVCNYSRFPHKHTFRTSLKGNPGYYSRRFVFVWPSLQNVELRNTDRMWESEKLVMVLCFYWICNQTWFWSSGLPLKLFTAPYTNWCYSDLVSSQLPVTLHVVPPNYSGCGFFFFFLE